LPGEDVTHQVEFTPLSLKIVVSGKFVLSIPKLAHEIADAKAKLSSGKDRLVVQLKKQDPALEWKAIK